MPSSGSSAPARWAPGIAQLAAAAGARTLVHDPDPERSSAGWRRRASGSSDEAGARLEPGAPSSRALADADVVIEAAPESLELKRELFGARGRGRARRLRARHQHLLAVGHRDRRRRARARARRRHALLQPGAGDEARRGGGGRALRRAGARAHARARPGDGQARDRRRRRAGLPRQPLQPPVRRSRRCGWCRRGWRRLEQVDRICRLGGGFRMGPFELMDLVGIDVGFEVSKSFYAQSFGEPRWRPSMLAARKVAAGNHGRKTGRGWYEYPEDGEHRPPDADPPAAGGGDGLVVIARRTALADELRDAAARGRLARRRPGGRRGRRGPRARRRLRRRSTTRRTAPLQGGPQVILCDEAPLAELDPDGPRRRLLRRSRRSAASSSSPRSPTTSDAAARAAERFFASLGRHVEWVGDAPGLVLGRIVCQLVNEACFALGDGVGAPEDIDAGMVLGLNHPRGPLEWGDEIGPSRCSACSPALYDEYREERYRAAPGAAAGGPDGRAAPTVSAAGSYSAPMRRALLTTLFAAPHRGRPARAAASPPPMVLPGDAAAAGIAAAKSTWLVGARPSAARPTPSPPATAGAAIGTGAYVVASGRARELAAALRARGPAALRRARPPRQAAADPAARPARRRHRLARRDRRPVARPAAGHDTSPLLALVDSTADVSHPEFAGGSSRRSAASRSRARTGPRPPPSPPRPRTTAASSASGPACERSTSASRTRSAARTRSPGSRARSSRAPR